MFKRVMSVKETQQAISRILDATKDISRYHSQSTFRYLLRKGSSSKQDIKQLKNRISTQLRHRHKTTNYQKKTSQTFLDCHNQFWATHYRKKEKFCGDIILQHTTKPIFKHLITKYKRKYHPSNASKGENDTSQDDSRQPKKSVQFRQSMKEEQLKSELRRMTVLSRVIGQNNRREARLMRQKSIYRHKSLA